MRGQELKRKAPGSADAQRVTKMPKVEDTTSKPPRTQPAATHIHFDNDGNPINVGNPGGQGRTLGGNLPSRGGNARGRGATLTPSGRGRGNLSRGGGNGRGRGERPTLANSSGGGGNLSLPEHGRGRGGPNRGRGNLSRGGGNGRGHDERPTLMTSGNRGGNLGLPEHGRGRGGANGGRGNQFRGGGHGGHRDRPPDLRERGEDYGRSSGEPATTHAKGKKRKKKIKHHVFARGLGNQRNRLLLPIKGDNNPYNGDRATYARMPVLPGGNKESGRRGHKDYQDTLKSEMREETQGQKRIVKGSIKEGGELHRNNDAIYNIHFARYEDGDGKYDKTKASSYEMAGFLELNLDKFKDPSGVWSDEQILEKILSVMKTKNFADPTQESQDEWMKSNYRTAICGYIQILQQIWDEERPKSASSEEGEDGPKEGVESSSEEESEGSSKESS